MTDSSPQKDRSLTFGDLKLETMVLELRYPFAFLLWDTAGSFWHDIENKLPGNFLVLDASPASVQISYDKYDILVQLERFAVSTSHPKATFNEFLDVLKVLYENLIDKLKIETFSRIGFRQIFVKEYPNIRKVVEMVRLIPSLALPQKLLSDYENNFVSPGLTIRIEDENKGKLFNLRGVTRDFQVTIPPVFEKELDIKKKSLSQSLVTFDIDFYTKVDMSIGQLSIVDWIKEAQYAVKKDAANFF